MKYVLKTVKELIILSGMYFFINVLLAVGIPLLVGYMIEDNPIVNSLGAVMLIMSVVYIAFFFFGKTDMIEYKSKLMIYALLTPARRIHQVTAKYIIALASYLLALLGYLAARLINSSIPGLTFGDIAYSFLIFSILIGIYFLIYYKFGYEAVKFLPQVMILLGTFGSVAVVKIFDSVSLEGLVDFITRMRPYALIAGFVICLLTFIASCSLYKNKDL
ncbi:MAG: ABC-2 transporter permease [Lachnospiraceae bacterium]|nr:ABC-2 transporter permease [Lachnospiraceae bacterium]